MLIEEHFQHPLLSAAEEKRLAKKIEKGDLEARRYLVECNLRLVVHYVNKLTVEERHRDDLIQEGNVGLLIAVDKFNWRRGTKFSTYATWWIRQRIRKAMPGLNEIGRLPQHIWDKFWRYQKTGEPEVAVEDLEKAGRFLRGVGAVEESVLPGRDEEVHFEDVVEERELIAMIEDLFDCLDERTQKILVMRFGIGMEHGMTLRQISRKMGVSVERIRQIARDGIQDLRKLLKVSLDEGE
jgi:RNA polymerase primary sigma factor